MSYTQRGTHNTFYTQEAHILPVMARHNHNHQPSAKIKLHPTHRRFKLFKRQYGKEL